MSELYPLAVYEGAAPAAPTWFREAVDTPSIGHEIIVDGARISYRQWGDSNNPGLLLVHGNAAHENWYDFIAPTFMDKFNVIAMTFSGMGDSDWRDSYSTEQFSADQMGVLQHSGMLDHDVKPIIVGHSYGGLISLATAAQFGTLFRGVVALDTPIFPPETDLEAQRPRVLKNDAFYTEQSTALGRFRLLPTQPCDNHYILDYIARHSLKPVEQNGTSGWTWKLDPMLWEKMDGVEKGVWAKLPSIPCPFAFFRGEESVLLTPEVKTNMLTQVQVPFVTIKNAGHHLFLDNPLDVIAELQTLLDTWCAPR